MGKKYYNLFSKIYDLSSPRFYYDSARSAAVEQLKIPEDGTVLVLPCGTGQSFELIKRFYPSASIIGIDYSEGMLGKARERVSKNNWQDINLMQKDATELCRDELEHDAKLSKPVDAVYFELGLSVMPLWKTVIDNSLAYLGEHGRIVIMDWYMEKPSLRGKFIKIIGQCDIKRATWQYLETRVSNFYIDSHFNRGGVFVCSGSKDS